VKIGVIIIPNLKELTESKKRLFRKRRRKLENKGIIKLEKVLGERRGVYFIPLVDDTKNKSKNSMIC
jgi:hypothetical protein